MKLGICGAALYEPCEPRLPCLGPPSDASESSLSLLQLLDFGMLRSRDRLLRSMIGKLQIAMASATEMVLTLSKAAN